MHNPDTTLWKGYTLDEIRVKRIVGLTRIELEKAKLMSATQHFTNSDKRMSASPILSKISNALDYVDYASLAFTFGKRILRIFRRGKKKK